MKMIQTLPTDKRGNIYYGPRTTDEAMQQLRLTWKDCRSTEERIAETDNLITRLRNAGFTGVANAVMMKCFVAVWSNAPMSRTE